MKRKSGEELTGNCGAGEGARPEPSILRLLAREPRREKPVPPEATAPQRRHVQLHQGNDDDDPGPAAA